VYYLKFQYLVQLQFFVKAVRNLGTKQVSAEASHSLGLFSCFQQQVFSHSREQKGDKFENTPRKKKRVEKMKTEVRKIKTEENGRIECSSNKRTYS
jgi:hypothetical protein